jgi:hypothetical protein
VSTLDQRIQDLAAALGQDVSVLQDALLALASGPLPVVNHDDQSAYTRVNTTVTSSGTTTIYAPSPGKRVRLHSIQAINDPFASASTFITVSIGPLVAYSNWVVSGRQWITGAVDEPLTVTLSAAGNVGVTATLEETT